MNFATLEVMKATRIWESEGMRELPSLPTGNAQSRQATKPSKLIHDGETNSYGDSGTIQQLGLERFSMRQSSQLP